MRVLNLSYGSSKENLLDANGPVRNVSLPLLENDILYLQDIFLKNGVHKLKVKSKVSGRKILSLLLGSMHYHKNVGILSMDLSQEFFNIYQALQKNYLPNNLVEFFIDQFYFDFLCIEEDEKLKKQQWYSQFEKFLEEFNFNQSIPIIKISYV